MRTNRIYTNLHRRPTALAVALILAISLFLTACAVSEPGATPTTGSTSTAPTSGTSEPTETFAPETEATTGTVNPPGGFVGPSYQVPQATTSSTFNGIPDLSPSGSA